MDGCASENDPEIRWAFEHGMISTENAISPLNHYGYMDAFNYSCDESKGIDQIVADAATEFQKLFGYHSNTFVASCYVWNECLEKALRKQGVFRCKGAGISGFQTKIPRVGLKKEIAYGNA